MRRRFLHLCLNLCLAGVSIVGTIALFEGAVRFLNPTLPFALFPAPGNCLKRTARASQEFQPNCTGVLSGTTFSTNAAGLRGADIRDDGSIRILALGDSCTWGWKVADDETYPARLQQLLDHRWGTGRYQVLNGGVPGTTSYEGLLVLKARLAEFRPALVLVAYGFNDADTGGDVEALIARQARFLPVLRLDDWLLHQSLAYKWMRFGIWQRRKPSPRPRVPVENYHRNLSEMVMISRAHGASIMFVGFNAGLAHGAARARVAETLGVSLVRYAGEGMDIVHPSARGYRDLAAHILDRLTVDGTLGSLRAPRE